MQVSWASQSSWTYFVIAKDLFTNHLKYRNVQKPVDLSLFHVLLLLKEKEKEKKKLAKPINLNYH